MVNSLRFLPGFLVASSFLFNSLSSFSSSSLTHWCYWDSFLGLPVSIYLFHLPTRVLQMPRLLPSLPWLRVDKGPCLPAWLPELDLREPTQCQGRTAPCKLSCELHNAPPRRNRAVNKRLLLSLSEEACLFSPLMPLSSILLPSLLEPLALVLLCFLVIQVQDTFLDSGLPRQA